MKLPKSILGLRKKLSNLSLPVIISINSTKRGGHLDILETIKTRRSVREFTDESVAQETLKKVLEAGQWAPSGLNNQPWRFVIIEKKEVAEKLAQFTTYSHIIKSAQVVIAVFLEKEVMYDRTKDVLSIGACIQNMLLEAHSLGLGSCWLGEILNQREAVERFLSVPESYELMAVVCLGHPAKKERRSHRQPLTDLVFSKL